MSETLLGCPFCGTQPNLRRSVEEYPADNDGPAGEFDVQTSVDCDECGISVSAEYRDEAIEAWNRRTPSLPASAEGGEATHRHKAQASTSEEMVERLRRALQGAKVVIGMMVRPEGLGQQLNEALDHRTAAIDAALKAETSR